MAKVMRRCSRSSSATWRIEQPRRDWPWRYHAQLLRSRHLRFALSRGRRRRYRQGGRQDHRQGQKDRRLPSRGQTGQDRVGQTAASWRDDAAGSGAKSRGYRFRHSIDGYRLRVVRPTALRISRGQWKWTQSPRGNRLRFHDLPEAVNRYKGADWQAGGVIRNLCGADG
jgi:hypothetical protein